MTKEKLRKEAEEYENNEINKMFVDESEEVYVRASTLKQIIKNSHLKGLAEGEKIGKEKQWKATEKAQKKTSAKIKELEKENAELKELAKLNFNLEKEISELKKICDFNCPVHKLATHNACVFCPACRNSPYYREDFLGKSDEEIEAIRKEVSEEL